MLPDPLFFVIVSSPVLRFSTADVLSAPFPMSFHITDGTTASEVDEYLVS